MLRECKICNSTYDFCPTCGLTKNVYKNAGYCNEGCYHISMILQKYGSKLATAVETIEALKLHGIDEMSLQPNIKEYYTKILAEAEAQKPKRKFKIKEEVIPYVDVEVVIKDEDTTTSEDE